MSPGINILMDIRSFELIEDIQFAMKFYVRMIVEEIQRIISHDIAVIYLYKITIYRIFQKDSVLYF